jgi:hypothetical protein
MKEAQKQQVVTKSFGQRVDLYPNFNIFNDMKDSIYVKQEGRTVGDVEVLPGKTLSGCLTNSNLTVSFMGGKYSKVIDSNELRTLIPSLTVKEGELSPTLDISKVLNDISIKKYNSLEKSAGFIPSVELPKYEMLPEPKYKEYEMRSYIIEHPSGSKLKSGDYEYEVVNPNNRFNWKQISTGKTGTFDLKAVGVEKWNEAAKTLNGLQKSASIGSFAEMRKIAEDIEYPEVYAAETKENYIERARQGGSTQSDANLGANYDKFVASYSTQGKAPASRSGSAAKSATPLKINYPIGTRLQDNSYIYRVEDPVSLFSWIENKTGGKSGTFTLNQGGVTVQKWNTAVTRLNDKNNAKVILEPKPTQPATPAAQTNVPAATTPTAAEQAKTEAQKPAEATRQFDPSTLAGVKAVLIRAAKPGGFGLSVGTAANERRRIQKMIETISSSEGASIDAYDFLTKMLLVSPRGDTYLTAFFRGASQADIDAILNSPRKDVVADPKGGKYNRQVAAVLSVLNEVYDGDFSENNKKAIKDFKDKYVKASKLNNDITKTSSKVDPKIKKLATLRRLRVRSQMEEATESATRFGRSRIS